MVGPGETTSLNVHGQCMAVRERDRAECVLVSTNFCPPRPVLAPIVRCSSTMKSAMILALFLAVVTAAQAAFPMGPQVTHCCSHTLQ